MFLRSICPTGKGCISAAMICCFLSADWSKRPDKRSVYMADVGKRRIGKCEPSGGLWDVEALVELAQRHARAGAVLVGVDAALGVPAGYWRMVLDGRWARRPETFVDWLGGLDVSGGFFGTVVAPGEWRAERPWFKVAEGAGGRTAFTRQVDGGMLRRIDAATGANPVFAVAGIPGTVGSGTRAFWKELLPHLSGDRDFAIWPFEGDLRSLLASHGVVLCETYPALAYAAALADCLPTGRITNAKTKRKWRNETCDRLARAQWVGGNRIDLGDLNGPRANEDDFDAHLTAAAVLRCIHEGLEIASPEWTDATAEGAMLLAGVVDPRRRSGTSGRRARGASASRAGAGSGANGGEAYPCPIPGCGKVFAGSRGGWDAHVGSARLHPQWRRGVADPEERKRLFREEFGDWFE